MIVVHFFLRKMRGATWLMADSSATPGLDPAFGRPVQLFKTDDVPESEWAGRAVDMLKPVYRGYELAVARPSNDDRESPVQVFDVLVKPAEAPHGGPVAGLARRLIRKLKGRRNDH